MAPDFNAQQLKDEQIEVDYDHFQEASEFPPPVPEGVYTLVQGKPTWEDKENEPLVFVFADGHKIVGGEYDGRNVARFDRVSTKSFVRGGIPNAGNMAVDHIRALGLDVRPHTRGEFQGAFASSEGRPFRAQLRWEGFCKHKGTPQEVADNKDGFSVKGARNFPQNGGGGHVDVIPCPVCKQEVRAREKINLRISG